MSHCNSYLLSGTVHVPGMGEIPITDVLKAYSPADVQVYLRGRVSRKELAAGYKRRMFFRHIEPGDENFKLAVEYWYNIIPLRDRQLLSSDEIYIRYTRYLNECSKKSNNSEKEKGEF